MPASLDTFSVKASNRKEVSYPFTTPPNLSSVYIEGYWIPFYLYIKMTLFTHNLTRLDLYECQFDVRIKFPSSLETLRFIFCYQPDLLSYEYWDELTKLKTLNIDCNGLENLEGWKPPPNLTHLSLMGSKFEELKSTWPLFSSPSVTPKLIDLDFSHISLCEIDSDIQLPPCLEILHLSEERISEDLLFPASFKKPSLFITY